MTSIESYCFILPAAVFVSGHFPVNNTDGQQCTVIDIRKPGWGGKGGSGSGGKSVLLNDAWREGSGLRIYGEK